MELQTVSQVSKTFGVSARMLRYYEQSGLLKSFRKEGYSYRVYDGENIRRLQQIVILRKLQIPVRQICVILNNPDAATALEIFKANISELKTEITALETIKSALEIFTAKIEEIAAVRLNLNLLTEDSVIKLADSLSLIQKNVKENKTMEELNSANETLNKTLRNLVRVVYRPTETVAKMWCRDCNPPDENAKITMEKFIKDTDLFKIKPDFKIFSHGVGDQSGSWFFVTIPEDMNVSAPFIKAPFEGGLWAVVTVAGENNDGLSAIDEWVLNNEDYQWNPGKRPRHEVYFNPLNFLRLKNTDLFNTVFHTEYMDIYVPIKEINKYTDKQNIKLIELLQNAEKSASQNEPADIDLTSMEKYGEVELKYENGFMLIKTNVFKNGMSTAQHFKVPMKIELRAKTSNTDIQICYSKGMISLKNIYMPDDLGIDNITDGNFNTYAKCGNIPTDQFIDIEWMLGRDIMAVKVNGQIRMIGGDDGYIAAFQKNPDFRLSAPVIIGTFANSTVTVEKLRVTELS